MAWANIFISLAINFDKEERVDHWLVPLDESLTKEKKEGGVCSAVLFKHFLTNGFVECRQDTTNDQIKN